MVDWCADNGIVLLPSLLPAGDYQLPNGKTLADQKANLLELYNDFAMPDNRLRYENAAMIASAHNMQLVYVVATDPQDAIVDLESLKAWSAPVPETDIVASGEKLYAHLMRCGRISIPLLFFAIKDNSVLPYTIRFSSVMEGTCPVQPHHSDSPKASVSRFLHQHSPSGYGAPQVRQRFRYMVSIWPPSPFS